MGKQVAVTGWHMQYKDLASNHSKFYTVLIADDGVVVTAWGRIGTKGQDKIQKLPQFADADHVGKRQLYSKRSKGYESVHEDVKFTMDEDLINKACEAGDSSQMTREFFKAVSAPQFDGDKSAVFGHYDEFVAKAQRLMDGASNRPFDAVFAEFDQLKAAWAEIDDKHAEASVTVSMIDQVLNQRLMSGSL